MITLSGLSDTVPGRLRTWHRAAWRARTGFEVPVVASLRGFGTATSGSVALMFGLAAVLLVGFVGAAFDYSRAARAQTGLQRAVDAAALLAAKNRAATSSYTLSDDAAANYLQGTFDVAQVSGLKVAVTFSSDSVRIDGSGDVPTTISNVIGIRTMPISGSAEATYGDTKIEVALVLDNTGSMAQRSKLTTLKNAAHSFLAKMQANANAAGPDAVRVALVPFDTDVNLGSYKTAAWVDSNAIGNWTAHPATAGCIWDRDQPNDAQDTTPASGVATTLFEADANRTAACGIGPVVPLTGDFGMLNTAIDAMNASGNTNLTIGLVWGLHMLTPSEPMTNAAPATTRNLTKYLVFMTDGLNTQDRWSMDPTVIDARTRQVCDTIKAAGIQVFTARIIEGNATLLGSCASSPGMYYDVQDVSQLDPVFTSIFSQITGSRIAR